MLADLEIKTAAFRALVEALEVPAQQDPSPNVKDLLQDCRNYFFGPP